MRAPGVLRALADAPHQRHGSHRGGSHGSGRIRGARRAHRPGRRAKARDVDQIHRVLELHLAQVSGTQRAGVRGAPGCQERGRGERRWAEHPAPDAHGLSKRPAVRVGHAPGAGVSQGFARVSGPVLGDCDVQDILPGERGVERSDDAAGAAQVQLGGGDDAGGRGGGHQQGVKVLLLRALLRRLLQVLGARHRSRLSHRQGRLTAVR